MLERLIAAANELFARFWLIVIIVLPVMLLYGFIKKVLFD
jgi:hypothetical protein